MFLELIQNKIVLSCVFGWFFVQLLKGILVCVKKRKFDVKSFFLMGHMPSSHSSFVSALSAGVFLEQGVSALFVVSAVFSLVIMRDAFGARWQIGENSKVINKFAKNKFVKNKLKEVTGHKLIEVIVGAILGVIIAILVFSI
ncbi:divergent PAP2 family protein [Candidatus Woesearchaeota archaeon]|nr:divergent PAP2 family protein [Candidatus Woesearchaeota archaeon]